MCFASQGTDKDTGLQYTMWGPMLGKRFLVFLDDFNMPKRETYGAQPPVELMRQMVDHGGWYDRKTFRVKRVVDVTVLGAMGPPGGGRQPVTNRMLRHMHMLAFSELESAEIEGIFHTITSAFLRAHFSEELSSLSDPLVKATIRVFTITCDSLRPTPAKPHYTFNLREVSKVIQGVLMADKRRVKERSDLIRLWTHECQRVFSDRLINAEDRGWFRELLVSQTQECFKIPFSQVAALYLNPLSHSKSKPKLPILPSSQPNPLSDLALTRNSHLAGGRPKAKWLPL